MALTVVNSGTTSALVIGTETNLTAAITPSSPTVYAVEVDFENLVSGEVAFFRIYTTTLAAGNEKQFLCRSFIAGTDSEIIIVSVPVPADVDFRATVQQKNGSGRTVPWKIYAPE